MLQSCTPVVRGRDLVVKPCRGVPEPAGAGVTDHGDRGPGTGVAVEVDTERERRHPLRDARVGEQHRSGSAGGKHDRTIRCSPHRIGKRGETLGVDRDQLAVTSLPICRHNTVNFRSNWRLSQRLRQPPWSENPSKQDGNCPGARQRHHMTPFMSGTPAR